MKVLIEEATVSGIKEIDLLAVNQDSFKFFLECCLAHVLHESAPIKTDGEWAMRLKEFVPGSESTVDVCIVECEGASVGYLSLVRQFSTFDASHYLYIDCLYLNPQWRGMGLGKRLMTRVMEIAIAQGCRFIEWQTPTSNEPAIRFYNCLGADSTSKVRFRWSLAKLNS